MIAASGWLISWASPAAISPSWLMRAARSSSAWRSPHGLVLLPDSPESVHIGCDLVIAPPVNYVGPNSFGHVRMNSHLQQPGILRKQGMQVYPISECALHHTHFFSTSRNAFRSADGLGMHALAPASRPT